MGRPKATDALHDTAAREVREAIRKVWRLKGLTNNKIADFLGEDPRWLTSRLVNGSRLRASDAEAILNALGKMQPRTGEERKLIMAARPWLDMTLAARRRIPKPAALIPTKDVGALATVLADALASALKKRPTRRPRRTTLRDALKRALGNVRLEMATTFADEYEVRFTAGGYLAYVAALRDFGDPERFDRIFLRRRLDGIAKLNAAAQVLEDLGVGKAEVRRLIGPVYKAARERIALNDFPDSLESE
jgi:hypothetical protein